MDYSSLLGGGGSKGNKTLSSSASDTIINANRTGANDNLVLYIVAGLAALIILAFVAKR